MARRICAGCGAVTAGGRSLCACCARDREGIRRTRRGTTAARGYDERHAHLRAELKPYVESGQALCAEIICIKASRYIERGDRWDLAHDDTGGYRGPAHAACNRAEAGRRSATQRASTR